MYAKINNIARKIFGHYIRKTGKYTCSGKITIHQIKEFFVYCIRQNTLLNLLCLYCILLFYHKSEAKS